MTSVTLQDLRNFYPTGLGSGGLGASIYALPKHDCVYVRNPKAACSTIILWLHRVHTGDHEFSPKNVHASHQLPGPREIGWPMVGRMLGGESFRFTFVRDPIQRAESAYIDKVQRQRHLRREIQHALGQEEDVDRVPSIEEFVAALEQTEALHMDPHWRPQHLNIMHGLVDYDLIGRLETFDRDFSHVIDATGIDSVPMEFRNRRFREASMLSERSDLRARVEKVYARDMEIFGY